MHVLFTVIFLDLLQAEWSYHKIKRSFYRLMVQVFYRLNSLPVSNPNRQCPKNAGHSMKGLNREIICINGIGQWYPMFSPHPIPLSHYHIVSESLSQRM